MLEQQSSSEIPSSIWLSMNSWFTPAVFFVLLNVMIATIALTSTFAKKNQDQAQNEPNFAGSVLQRIKSTSFLSYYNNRSQEPHNSSIYKQAPDSDAHFNSEQTHNHETESHYFFQDISAQDPQSLSVDTQIPDSDTEHSPCLETQSRYFSQENLQISKSQASNSIFEQTHEQNPRKSQTHFIFEQKDSNLDDFEQAQQERTEDSEPSEQSMDEVYSQLTGGNFIRTKSDTEPASGKTPEKLPAKMKKSASLKSSFGHFEEEKIVEARRPATVRERRINIAKVRDGDEGVDAKADDFIHKFKQQLKLQRLDSIIRYKDMIERGSEGK